MAGGASGFAPGAAHPAGGRGERLFDEGVPGLAIGAVAKPLRLVAATLATYEDALPLGHGRR